MPKLSGTHLVSFETIRSLAIECHALDLSAFMLLVAGTHQPSRSTTITYEELVTSKLLMLSVAIRTKRYQGVPHADTEKYILDCGVLDVTSKGKEASHSFTIKDICDKVIHADEVERIVADGNNGQITVLRGKQLGKSWQLHFSISLFAEGVLNWLDEIPDT